MTGQVITYVRTASRGSGASVRVDGVTAGTVGRAATGWAARTLAAISGGTARTSRGFGSRNEAAEWLARFLIPGVDPDDVEASR